MTFFKPNTPYWHKIKRVFIIKRKIASVIGQPFDATKTGAYSAAGMFIAKVLYSLDMIKMGMCDKYPINLKAFGRRQHFFRIAYVKYPCNSCVFIFKQECISPLKWIDKSSNFKVTVPYNLHQLQDSGLSPIAKRR